MTPILIDASVGLDPRRESPGSGPLSPPSLMASEDLYREYFERSADATLIIMGETFVDCNQAVVDMLRYKSHSELLQTHPSELSPEYQPDGLLSFDKANRMMAIAIAKGSHRFEWNHKRADGEVFPVEVLLTAIPAKEGVMLHTVWRDLTNRKRMEAEIIQAQKMAAVDKLIGSIAHDFNNLLVAILGNAELMDMELDRDRDAILCNYLADIRIAGDRAAELVRQLLAYSRKQILDVGVFDLNEVPAVIGPILKHIIGRDLVVEIETHSEPVPVKADSGQLEQVLINLATNACEAMPGGGRISIRVFRAELEGWQSQQGSRFSTGSYAVLEVEDSGPGIDPDIVDKIFEPFFTTKRTGKGLGLSTVCGIINQSGGDIQVKTTVGSGTKITVCLPISREEIAPEIESTNASETDDGTGRVVLLVEDEPTVGRLAEHVLRRQNYQVIRAANGREVLDMVDNEGIVFDLLLTDVMMPKMGGPELARNLSTRVKNLKVLYISGYTDDVLSSSGMLDADVELINKPYTVDQLQAAINRAMNGASSDSELPGQSPDRPAGEC